VKFLPIEKELHYSTVTQDEIAVESQRKIFLGMRDEVKKKELPYLEILCPSSVI
jgi:hypothetical protein